MGWVYGVAADVGKRVALDVDKAALNPYVLPRCVDLLERTA